MSQMPSSIESPPPPPPSPPPLPPTSPPRATVMFCIKLQEPLPPRQPVPAPIYDICLWANDNLELQKACYIGRVCRIAKPKQCQYNDIASIQQVGPTCGLTALSMLLKGAITSQELLNVAISRRYTNNGEMFSTKYLYDLLCEQMTEIEMESMPHQAVLHKGRLDCNEIKECLQAGACLLVPYPFKKTNN